MGNRAFVAFTDRNQSKPRVGIYLHWNGGPETVYAIVDVLKERGCLNHSAGYTTARFAHLACHLLDGDGLSVGIDTFTTPMQCANCADDNGLYIYDIGSGEMQRYISTGFANQPRKLSPAEVKSEERRARLHKYWHEDSIREQLRAAFQSAKEAA